MHTLKARIDYIRATLKARIDCIRAPTHHFRPLRVDAPNETHRPTLYTQRRNALALYMHDPYTHADQRMLTYVTNTCVCCRHARPA
jgi:hypothetical protein